jgi:aubergine
MNFFHNFLLILNRLICNIMGDDFGYGEENINNSSRFRPAGQGRQNSRPNQHDRSNSRPGPSHHSNSRHERSGGNESNWFSNQTESSSHGSNARHSSRVDSFDRDRRERDYSNQRHDRGGRSNSECQSSRDRSSSFNRHDDNRGQKRGRESFGGNNRGGRGSGRGSGRGGGRGGKRFKSGMNGKKQQKEEKPEFHDQIVTRPKGCVKTVASDENNQIKIVSNFIAVRNIRDDIFVRQYMVDFDPRIDERNKGLRFKIINSLKEVLKFNIYSGGGTIFLLEEIENERLSTEIDGRSYSVKFKFQHIVDSTKADFLQVMNEFIRATMRSSPDLNLQLIDNDHFDASRIIRHDQHRLNILPGYKTGIKKYENDNLICVRQISKIVRDTKILDLINSHRNNRDLIGKVVVTSYNNKKYKIASVDNSKTPLSTFDKKDGTKISYKDYYQQVYQVRITDLRQPILVAKPTAKDARGKRNNTDLIPELCRETDLDDSERKNVELMRSIADSTRKTPAELYDFIKDFHRKLLIGSSSKFEQSGMELGNELVELNARDISDNIIMRDKKTKLLKKFSSNAGDWSENVKNSAFYKNVSLKRWYLLCPEGLEEHVQGFLHSFSKPVIEFGDVFETPREIIYYKFIADDVAYKLSAIQSKNPSFIMIITLGNGERDKGVYKEIKKLTLKGYNHPIATQVITRNIMLKGKKDLSYVSKIAIQVNAKLGGIPWLIDLKYDGLMIFGIDISKDKFKKDLYSSCVAHLNPMGEESVKNGKAGGTFFSMSMRHIAIDELSGEIKNYFFRALKEYERRNGSLPKKIIGYRDGVSDGKVSYLNLKIILEYFINLSF